MTESVHCTFNEVGVVAALPQLHHCVDQVGKVGLASALGQEGEVLFQDGAVVLFLDVGQLHLDDGLLFGSQLLLHILRGDEVRSPPYLSPGPVLHILLVHF